MPDLTAWSTRLLSLLRIIVALLFMEHGLMKLLHFPVAQAGAPDPLPSLLIVAGLIEIIGGALLTVGLFTRVAAFVCSGEMAIAYFMAHSARSPWPAVNQGEAAILFCFIFLYLSAAGGGSWSADALIDDRVSPSQ